MLNKHSFEQYQVIMRNHRSTRKDEVEDGTTLVDPFLKNKTSVFTASFRPSIALRTLITASKMSYASVSCQGMEVLCSEVGMFSPFEHRSPGFAPGVMPTVRKTSYFVH
ncbi:hypothetical protein Peur_024833 [Populus x canadensis]